jgi:dihydropteroate synthase
MQWRCRGRLIDLSRPIVMGVLNVTPDSFSDGGRYSDSGAALARAHEMVAEGAAILDIGGESTRPGALPVAAAEQIKRVVPIIERVRAELDVAISIDTSAPEVMDAALSAGACIVNDIQALRAAGARAVCAASEAGVCLMHMQGEPRNMQLDPQYQDVVGEIAAFLLEARVACEAAGIDREAVVFDPGFGFGKALAHNMTLLKELAALAGLGSPLLVGFSRKSVVGQILGKRLHDRLYGGLGLASLAVIFGARIIRTHDVGPTVDAIGAVSAVMQGIETK